MKSHLILHAATYSVIYMVIRFQRLAQFIMQFRSLGRRESWINNAFTNRLNAHIVFSQLSPAPKKRFARRRKLIRLTPAIRGRSADGKLKGGGRERRLTAPVADVLAQKLHLLLLVQQSRIFEQYHRGQHIAADQRVQQHPRLLWYSCRIAFGNFTQVHRAHSPRYMTFGNVRVVPINVTEVEPFGNSTGRAQGGKFPTLNFQGWTRIISCIWRYFSNRGDGAHKFVRRKNISYIYWAKIISRGPQGSI